jgi:hypothetical protein
MRHFTILPVLMITSFVSAFSLRDQGYFDLGFGPAVVDKAKTGLLETEYNVGPLIQTSVGMAYKNGLGLGLVYQFNYNGVKTEITDDDIAPEFTSYIAMLNFVYKLIPSSEFAFFMQGGPGFLVTTDQKLQSTATETTDATVTTTTVGQDGIPTSTTTAVTVDANQAADPFQYYDNYSFGYQIGGGLEYRYDNHKSMIIQINYLQGDIYRSTYSAGETARVTTFSKGGLDSYSGAITLRYYM